MSRATRYFLTGSFGFLVIGLGAGLVAYYNAVQGVSPSARPDVFRFVPADASVVAYANVRDIMASPFGERVQRLGSAGRERRELETKTGVNVQTDVDHVVASLLPRPGDRGGGLVLLRGRFDEAKLESLAKDEGGTLEHYRDVRMVFLGIPPGVGTARQDWLPAIGFLEPGLIALGDRETIRRAIDLGASGALGIGSNDQFMRLVGEVEQGSTAWVVAHLDTLAGRPALPAEVEQYLPAVRWLAAGGRIRGDVSVAVHAEARDAASAEDLREVVRGVLALVKLRFGARDAGPSGVNDPGRYR